MQTKTVGAIVPSKWTEQEVIKDFYSRKSGLYGKKYKVIQAQKTSTTTESLNRWNILYIAR